MIGCGRIFPRVEVMEIAGGLIQHHRIYWGWFGSGLLVRSAVEKAKAGVPN